MGSHTSVGEDKITQTVVLKEQRHYPTSSKLKPSNLLGISSLSRTKSFVERSLPKQLKTHADSVMVLTKFWATNISSLLDNNEKTNEYQMLAMVFYTNLFKSIPSARQLFLGKNIKIQAMQYIGMIGWLITSLTKPNAKNIIKKLSKLGLDHKKRGVKYEYYPIMLNCLHEALAEKFSNEYNLRVKFCLTQLFNIISDIMIGNDLNARLSKQSSLDNRNNNKLNKNVILQFITSFDDCISHPIGLNYLELFMKQQFCIELLMFYKDYEKYRGLISLREKQKHGRLIMDKYILIKSPCEINISYETRSNIIKALEKTNGIFTENMFDSAVQEVRVLINTSIWTDFRKTMIELADIKAEYRQHMSRVNTGRLLNLKNKKRKEEEIESSKYKKYNFTKNDEIKENNLDFTNYDLDIGNNGKTNHLRLDRRKISYNTSNTSTSSNISTSTKSLPNKLVLDPNTSSLNVSKCKVKEEYKRGFTINYLYNNKE